MKIRVQNQCSYKGDIYLFSLEFFDWLEGEIASRVEESEAFTKKYGKDWTLNFNWDTGRRIKQPKLSGPWIDRKYKEMSCTIALPYARHTSPEQKAYVPELRQVLERLADFLSHEQIDTSKLKKDTEALLKHCVSRPGMLKHDPHPYTFAAEKKAAERLVRSKKVKLLKKDASVRDCLKRYPRNYKHKFDIAFDAADHPSRKKGWQSDYAVIDLTVVLPASESDVPNDLFDAATELFRCSATALKRSRTFLCLRIVPKSGKPDWSVAMLLSSQHTDPTYKLIAREASAALSLLVNKSPFKEMYSDGPHAMFAYSNSLERIIGFPSQAPIKFNESLDVCSTCEKEVLAGSYGENTARMSAFYVGNAHLYRDEHQEAIKFWNVPEAITTPEAWVNIGIAYSKMGDMEKCFRSCKKAIGLGVKEELLNDPDFTKFHSHPLFTKLKQLLPSKSRQSKNIGKPSRPLPAWKIPKNIQKRVEGEDGMWEDERFDPILLTIISGTSYEGRDIPLSWQIEFDPFDDRCEAANTRLQTSGIEPDGDGWAEVIEKEFVKRYPELKDELHLDSESSTCVLWVESESACKKLIELVWSVIYLK